MIEEEGLAKVVAVVMGDRVSSDLDIAASDSRSLKSKSSVQDGSIGCALGLDRSDPEKDLFCRDKMSAQIPTCDGPKEEL